RTRSCCSKSEVPVVLRIFPPRQCAHGLGRRHNGRGDGVPGAFDRVLQAVARERQLRQKIHMLPALAVLRLAWWHLQAGRNIREIEIDEEGSMKQQVRPGTLLG